MTVILTIIGVLILGAMAYISTLHQENKHLRKSLDLKDKSYDMIRKAYYQERQQNPMYFKEKQSSIVDN